MLASTGSFSAGREGVEQKHGYRIESVLTPVRGKDACIRTLGAGKVCMHLSLGSLDKAVRYACTTLLLLADSQGSLDLNVLQEEKRIRRLVCIKSPELLHANGSRVVRSGWSRRV